MAIFDKMGVVWPLIIDQRLVHLTHHMFPCHRSHSWISRGDHFLGKNLNVLAFGIIENCHSWLFSTKMGVVWPLIFVQSLIHLTTHMFPCHRSHSWIYGVLGLCFVAEGLIERSDPRMKLFAQDSRRCLFAELRHYKPT
jgi:hypothetical protein